MPFALKVLGQLNPSAATLSSLYTVPLSTSAVVSTITVANRSSVDTVFRIAVSPGGASIDVKHYIYYDLLAPGNDTFVATIGLTLSAGDIVRVYAEDATLSFSMFGEEST